MVLNVLAGGAFTLAEKRTPSVDKNRRFYYISFCNSLADGVMVARQILVLFVRVQILLGQLLMVPSSIG